MYKVDWTKIKTLEEVLTVLTLLEVQLTDTALEDNPHMKDYVIEIEED
ncbi:MAG: hypothetical protein ISR74_06385 [Candidatus Thioglobus sp.]|nr:hypothetical protein [Candidatus Thioglobus sp.]